jgi:cell wall-associated NlpC family hydrolase
LKNAYRTLRISLAAAAMLLLFAEIGFTAQTYKVCKGDTLYSIATRHGVSVTALKQVNKLSSTGIKPGLTLTIPTNQRTAAASEPVVYGISTRDELNVETDGKVIASVAKGTKFTVIAREGSRYSVKLSDGKTGWVSASAVNLVETRKPTPISDTWGIKKGIVQMALAYRGHRYVRGGESPGGFDCSGFVKYIYAKHGVKLPHDSRALFQCGELVNKADLQEGDILFFVNTYRRGISHVGMYIGEGKFIHAATSRLGVRVDALDSPYYKSRYFAAKRVK